MALEEYRRKRDFTRTAEPAPSRIKSRAKNLAYLIQKHDATRLHYDFRLELDGVLLSWAVTKGPSLNPADKRLAVRTEDHPLAYGSFEGIIPQGEYGGGTVMLWDQGTWEPIEDPHAGLQKGHLSFILEGERLKGEWDLVRMHGDGKRENWLLIKRTDKYAKTAGASSDGILEKFSTSVTTGRTMDQIAGSQASRTWHSKDPAPKPVPATKATPSHAKSDLNQLIQQYPEAQLATLVEKPPDGSQWLHEIKFDGYRLLGFLSGGAAALRTRNGKDWTAKFPTIAAGLEKLRAQDAVLDMEAAVLDQAGKSSFHALQDALGSDPSKIVAYAFDLLHLDGQNLTSRPLTERKEKLEALLANSKPAALFYSKHIIGQGARLFKEACGKGLEGIVSKEVSSAYTPGRQRSWLKSKCSLRQEFIILGSSDARTGERALGALYLGYRKSGKLEFAGKVGTGFTMKSASDLAGRLKSLAVKKPTLTRPETGIPAGEYEAIHWIKPVLLAEVSFTEWTNDGRIRHPSFQGLREDKDAAGVTPEVPTETPRAGKK